MESSAAKITSLLSFGKEILLIFTLNCVSSWRSQSDASKGDVSTRSLIALVVALPGVSESCVAAAAAKLLRALLVERVGTNGRC
jgi:hypothetical protein